MKTIIILADGMADYPVGILGDLTPMQKAVTPNMDSLCRMGRSGRLVTVPEDMPPGSEIANLSVLGYDVHKVYQGRGVLEAAAMGVELDDTDLAMRCNLICIESDRIKNHSAGHISSEEARELIECLNKDLGTDRIRFYPGVSYRHLLVVKNGRSDVDCTPPHDVPGTPFRDVLVKPSSGAGKETADLLNDLILKSHDTLARHPVNRKRHAEGKDPANSIWVWAPGHKPRMKTLKEKYGITGAVISAVDLIFGIGVYAGMKAVHVEGATGLYDTNYPGKARAAMDVLKEVDLVYLHIEAPDEAGHEGNAELKIRTLEDIDSQVVGPIMKAVEEMEEPVTLALLPDHPTPCAIRTHVRDAVPFVIARPGEEPDGVTEFNEFSVEKGSYGLLKNGEFMDVLLNRSIKS
ncbi:MAG TPA: cofactor-independent phosphoglycerate mutase [bacterium]|nr:cofactor-independent phosphoglycerate mutase [bacterium]